MSDQYLVVRNDGDRLAIVAGPYRDRSEAVDVADTEKRADLFKRSHTVMTDGAVKMVSLTSTETVDDERASKRRAREVSERPEKVGRPSAGLSSHTTEHTGICEVCGGRWWGAEPDGCLNCGDGI